MSGVALKITTLVIRTVSKPIANRIKAQAREHEGFRRICVGWAQLIHRVDMRLRLGLLQDPAVLERQAAREAADIAKKKRLAEAPTVKTEAQTRADEAAAKEAAKEGAKKAKKENLSRIKPLSEAKAIDLGSNFIAESFLFCVAVSTVLFETWRSRRKEGARRNDVAEQLDFLRDQEEASTRRIEELEAEVRDLRAHEWHWPWEGRGKPGEERRGAVTTAESKVLAEVAERERQRTQEQSEGKKHTGPVDTETSSSAATSSPKAPQPISTHHAAHEPGIQNAETPSSVSDLAVKAEPDAASSTKD